MTLGQTQMIEINKGKQVNVRLLFGDAQLFIHTGDNAMGEFRYIMHKAKNPRKAFDTTEFAMHSNIRAGYYYVNPMNIIF